MKRLLVLVLILCTFVSLLASCTGTPDVTDDTVSETNPVSAEAPDGTTGTSAEEDPANTSKVADLTLLDDGYDIYQLPGNGNGGWRYGPSYIYYGDGRVDAYFASGGDSGE